MFKTYDEAYTSLSQHLNSVCVGLGAHRNKIDLAIHRGFQEWATNNGIPKRLMADLAAKLVQYGQTYPSIHSSKVDKLVTTLPNEFNVRGNWTPELGEPE